MDEWKTEHKMGLKQQAPTFDTWNTAGCMFPPYF